MANSLLNISSWNLHIPNFNRDFDCFIFRGFCCFLGGSAVSDSLKIAQLVAGKGGAASTIEAGIRATAQLLGEDVGKEVRSNLILQGETPLGHTLLVTRTVKWNCFNVELCNYYLYLKLAT
jgi:hypothetical protein